MTELVETVGRSAVGVIRWLIIDAFVEFVLQGCGYLTLKALSFGRYPTSKQSNENICALTGALVLAVVISSVAFIYFT